MPSPVRRTGLHICRKQRTVFGGSTFGIEGAGKFSTLCPDSRRTYWIHPSLYVCRCNRSAKKKCRNFK